MISKECQIIYLLTGWLPSIEKDDQIKPLSAKEWSIVAKKIYESELNRPSDLQSKSKIEIGNIPYRPTEIWEMSADNKKAKSLLGWKPKIPFAEGLDRTIAWYRTYLEAYYDVSSILHAL